jgi:hypothetical protein
VKHKKVLHPFLLQQNRAVVKYIVKCKKIEVLAGICELLSKNLTIITIGGKLMIINYYTAKKKVSVLLLLVFAFTALFNTPAFAQAGTSTQVQRVLVANSTKDPVQLQWYLMGDRPDDFDQVSEKANEYLESKVNTVVNFNFIGWDEFIDGKKLLFAAGETIDIIFAAGWWNYKTDASKGLYYGLNSLLDQYAPKTKALLGKNVLKAAEIDGKIYALPVPGQTMPSVSGVAFRKDLIKKYNINISKIKKLEDIEPALKTIKSKHPSVTPLINTRSATPHYDILSLEPLEGGIQCPGSLSSNSKDNKVYNEFTKPEVMSYLKVLNKYYKAGYLKDTQDEFFSTLEGNYFAELSTDLSPLSDEVRQGYEWTSVRLAKPVLTKSDATACMNAVGYNSKYPKEALALQELINTDAYVNNLFHFGMEDKHYVKVSKNVIDYPDGITESTNAYQQTFAWMMGNRYLDFTWKNEDPNKYIKLKAFNDSATTGRSFGFEFDANPVQTQVDACETVWHLYVPKLLTGEYDPQKYIPILNAAFKKAGLDKVLAEKQTQFNAWSKAGSKSGSSSSASDIKLYLRGELLTLAQPPVSDAGTVLVPMKSIFDSLDAYSEYDSKTKTISVSKGNTRIKLTIGNMNAALNGSAAKLTAAPKMINNQVFVPLEFVCKALGFVYTWNKDAKTASITANQTPEQRGNAWGNISNYGYTASAGDWVYVSLYQTGLYKIKQDGSEKIKISDTSASFINVSGNWIYYAASYTAKSAERMRLFRMKTDGSEKTKLTDDQVTFVNVAGDWIYYINTSDGNKPYRATLDGKGIQKLSNDAAQSLFVEDGWIYFQKKADTKLFKMRTSGTNLKEITDNLYKNGAYINKTGDWIYYYSEDNYRNGICKIKTDGSNEKLVVNASISSMNCINGWIYYADDNSSLYKLNENEHTRIKLGSNIDGPFNIAGQWVYYTLYPEDEDNDETECRIKADGSVKQKFSETGTLSDLYNISSYTGATVNMPVVLPAATLQTTTKSAKEIAKYKDAVVHIKIYDDNGNQMASGSGFNIEASGIIVTNFHVIRGASSIKCTFDNKATYTVDYLLNYNAIKDIAILKLKDAQNLPTINMGDSDKIELADDVLAIGNPMELQNTISDGIVSGVRTILGIDYIQTTASISPGSSGGPLFNSYGDVIGITAMTITGSQNINFAVPINTVKKLFNSAHIIPIIIASNYESMFEEFEKNDDSLSADLFQVDQYIRGSIETEKDVDVYKFTLAHDRKVHLFGTFNTFDRDADAAKALDMTLLDQNNKEVSKGTITTEEGFDFKTISADLKAGTYYVSVKKGSTGKSSTRLDSYSILSVAD